LHQVGDLFELYDEARTYKPQTLLVIQSNSCTMHTLKHNHVNI